VALRPVTWEQATYPVYKGTKVASSCAADRALQVSAVHGANGGGVDRGDGCRGDVPRTDRELNATQRRRVHLLKGMGVLCRHTWVKPCSSCG
jgi:hypothetical protein